MAVQLSLAVPALAKHRRGDAAPLTVLVYNYAALAEQRLSAAEANAERGFRHVGIEVQWTECPTTTSQPEGAPPCQGKMEPTDIAVRIIEAGRNAESDGRPVLGSSVVTVGAHSYYSTIYHGSVRQLCASHGLYEEQVLAAAMTHEIGHLLLRSNQHSADGIMAGHWDQPDYQLIAQGQLAFSPGQVETLRREVEQRKWESADSRTRLAQSIGGNRRLAIMRDASP